MNMKKYKFVVKKVLKDEMEVKAENKKEALEKMIELLCIDEKIVFKSIDKKIHFYELTLDKITEIEERDKEEKFSFSDEEFNEIIEELKDDFVKEDVKSTGIKDDLPIEGNEFICHKYGNNIIFDEDI